MACWCQTWRCSLTLVTFARQFSPGTQPPEGISFDTFTPTSPKLNCLSPLTNESCSYVMVWWSRYNWSLETVLKCFLLWLAVCRCWHYFPSLRCLMKGGDKLFYLLYNPLISIFKLFSLWHVMHFSICQIMHSQIKSSLHTCSISI